MILDTALEYELSPFRQDCCLDIVSETYEKSRGKNKVKFRENNILPNFRANVNPV